MNVQIKPNRTNWKLFCQEPPLTDAEIAKWNEMASVIQQDDSLFDFIENETVLEWTALKEVERSRRSDDWSDLVQWADARRRLQRAEIRVYQEWKEKP